MIIRHSRLYMLMWAGMWASAMLACFHLPARAAMGDNMVSMNVHTPTPAAVDLAARLGIQWLRMDNNWRNHGAPCSDAIVPEPQLVTAVTHAVAQGLHVYMNLISPHPCGTISGNDDVDFNDVPIASLFANYVRQTVAIYRPMGVRHFSLWNEPNQALFFEGSIEQLVNHVLIPGFAAVAQGCHEAGYDDCLVLGPELAHQGDYDAYLEEVLERLQAAGLMFDILTHHSYQAVSTPIYERDSFINALDDRRFPVTRRSFIDVLSDVGLAHDGEPDLEVWVTETGYFADPPRDPHSMRAQANHFMEVLNVQLVRSWYTNTFFYELVDPGAGFDGFGITANNGDGTFFLKDAYLALQHRLFTDSRLSGPAPPGFEPNIGRICSRLGSSRILSILDQDPYRFRGVEGELVTVLLTPNPDGSHDGRRATLTLSGGGLHFRWSMSALANDITTTLPETTTYRIKVIEQPRSPGPKFTGDYCVTLESSEGAYQTLERD
ncbi:hypothetical protein [Candidatus Entotheonella palauensis]|uniref:hypothetical protein n=1 Tax=Candidatus Entotheonella palauensis TaxID=93172 RepID=UPI001177F8C1|nr:hypothetical protein [Candidatus Entotheonella palauensis]